MTHRRAALLVAAVALAIPRNARADFPPDDTFATQRKTRVAENNGPLHFADSPTITSAAGTVLALPPGYYLTDPQFAALDAELRRAQDAETRLRAENDSLRESAARSSDRGGVRLARRSRLHSSVECLRARTRIRRVPRSLLEDWRHHANGVGTPHPIIRASEGARMPELKSGGAHF